MKCCYVIAVGATDDEFFIVDKRGNPNHAVASFSLIIQDSKPDSFIGHVCALFYVPWFTRFIFTRNHCQIWTI